MAINRFLRVNDLMAITGMAQSTVYLRVRQGLFPRQIKLGLRCAAWPSNEIEEVLKAMTAGRSDAEVRELVKQLMKQRQDGAPLTTESDPKRNKVAPFKRTPSSLKD